MPAGKFDSNDGRAFYPPDRRGFLQQASLLIAGARAEAGELGSATAVLGGAVGESDYEAENEKEGGMTHRDTLNLSILLLVVLLGALPVYAQIDYATATLRGTVYDPNGGVIPGATVTVTNPATGVVKTAKTTAGGIYQVPALNPGTYQVAVEAQGFAKMLANSVLLTVGQIVV